MKPTIHRALASCASGATLLLAAQPAAAQNQYWIRQFGTTSIDYARITTPDGSGGVYFGGMTGGVLRGSSAGYIDAALARFDSAGNQLWVRQFGSNQQDELDGAAPDNSGGVYVGGLTWGSFGGQYMGSEDTWLARYDGAGNQLWVRHLGTSANDDAWGAAQDGSGGAYFSGETGGSLGGPSAGSLDIWLARYDGAGNQLWIRQFGSNAAEFGGLPAPDGSGGVFLTGITEGSLGGPLAGGQDGFLARYDGAGNQLWIRQFGTSADDAPNRAAPDGSGGVYVTGHTRGNLGGPSAGDFDVFVARYDGAGNQLWIRQLGSSGEDLSIGAALDDSGGVFLCGETRGNLGGPPAGDYDPWFAHYDGAGNLTWLRHLGTSVYDFANSAASDGAGGVFFGGSTLGSLAGQSAGDFDFWLARYGPSLPLLCAPGQGGVIACPCSNPASGPGRGCDNSSATGGASLSAAGEADLSADTLVFTAQDEKPTALSVLLQGTSEVSQGLVFGQGVRCAGGTLRRLYVHAAVGGAVTMPDVSLGDPSVSARSAALGDVIPPGQSRWYSVYYRDPIVSGACPAASTFNTGPTMRAAWAP